MKFRLINIILALLINISVSGQVYVDTEFGLNGLKLQHIKGTQDNAAHSLVDDQDRIYVASYFDSLGTYYPFIARFTENGFLDTSFGNSGVAILEQFNLNTRVDGICFQDDRLLVAVTDNKHHILRLLPDGTIDNSFGINGFVSPVYVDEYVFGAGILVNSNDKIVLLTNVTNNGKLSLLLEQFSQDGEVDKDFGNNGKIIGTFNDQLTLNFSAIEQTDGKLLISGINYPQYDKPTGILIRYNSNGSLDTEFGGKGYIVWQPSPSTYAVFRDAELQSNGDIIVVGYSYTPSPAHNKLLCVRFKQNGELDPTFANMGYILLEAENGGGLAYDGLIQSNDKILIGGSSYEGAPSFQSTYLVCRLDPTGHLDSGFGSDGIMMLPTGKETNVVTSLNFQVNRNIIVCGSAGNTMDEDQSDIGLIRLVNDIHDGIAKYSPVIKCFPNPASTFVKIDYPNILDIQLFNTEGQAVSMSHSNSIIDVSNLTNGFYTIQVLTNKESYNVKLSVMH